MPKEGRFGGLFFCKYAMKKPELAPFWFYGFTVVFMTLLVLWVLLGPPPAQVYYGPF